MNEVVCYVKNAGLSLSILYTIGGEEENDFPDFVVRVRNTPGDLTAG